MGLDGQAGEVRVPAAFDDVLKIGGETLLPWARRGRSLRVAPMAVGQFVADEAVDEGMDGLDRPGHLVDRQPEPGDGGQGELEPGQRVGAEGMGCDCTSWNRP
jgi:hypothetical protein